jgi:hypothetical protein
MAALFHQLMKTVLACVVLAIFCFMIARATVRADEAVDRRIAELENRINHQSRSFSVGGDDGAVLFLYGVFCALWAQNTNRNPWLWFFLGLFCSVVTVVVLLVKDAEDRQRKRRPEFGDFGS